MHNLSTAVHCVPNLDRDLALFSAQGRWTQYLVKKVRTTKVVYDNQLCLIRRVAAEAQMPLHRGPWGHLIGTGNKVHTIAQLRELGYEV